MIEGALEVGIDLGAFWKLTPRHLSWHQRAHRRRDERELTNHYAAASLQHLSRCGKRLPSLDDFLGRRRKPKILGNARDFMAHFAQSYAGRVVKREEPTVTIERQQETGDG